MAISYKKLWKLLIDKDMTAVELREKTGIAPNTMTKLRRDEEVSMLICRFFCYSRYRLGLLFLERKQSQH